MTFMLRSPLIAFAGAALLSFSLVNCSPDVAREVCGDGLDNDGNGLVDCNDPDCAGQNNCIPPDYGACSKCGQDCSVQSVCVVNYASDRPIPQCLGGKCTATEKFIQPRLELDTRGNWAGLTLKPASASTRFIKKKANDGSVVNCARVATIAADRNVSNAIEQSNQLVVQGLDVTRVTNPMLGQGISFAFVNTQTGGDYLVWVELWGGAPDSTTSLPTGRRFGYGCFEDASLTPLLLSDNCPSATNDAGTCRTFRFVMPPPEE